MKRHPRATHDSAQPATGRRQCRRSTELLVTLVALAIWLPACGGASPNSPSGGSIAGCSPSGCSTPGASAAAEAMAVRFSHCMRSHGATGFPDPTIGSNGLPSWTLNASENTQAPAYLAARKACKKDLPSLAPRTGAQKAAAHAAALKYAACMRSNGVPDFPDPNAQGQIQINAAGASSLVPSSAQFQKAQTDCKSLDNGFAQQASVAVSHASSGPGNGSQVPDAGG